MGNSATSTGAAGAIAEVASEAALAQPQLKVLTWNVWFDDYQQETRYNYIFNFVQEHNVDVACFQEVTIPFLNQLKDQSWLTYYDVSDPDLSGTTIGSYGVLMLVKKNLRGAFRFAEFPSRMGRSLLIGEIPLRDGSVAAIGTVHLESLDSASLRNKQLTISYTELSRYKFSILCGDFNFCSYRNFRRVAGEPLENDAMRTALPGYLDLWPELIAVPNLHAAVDAGSTPPPKEAVHAAYDNCNLETANLLGYTFDSSRNPMIRQRERRRYDRIMFKNTDTGIHPVCIQMVGVAEIAPNVLPSDHFGLLARFEQ